MIIRVYTTDGKYFTTENYGSADDVRLLIKHEEPVSDRRSKTYFNKDNVVAVKEER